MEKQTNKLASAISYLFHPMFMPTFGILYMYFSNKVDGFNRYVSTNQHEENITIIALTVVFSFLIPSIAVYFLKKVGKVSSFKMENREERILPFTITGISYFLCYHTLFGQFNYQASVLLHLFFIGCVLSILFALAITIKWKISIHMIGIGGFTGAIFLISSMPGSTEVLLPELIIALLISGIVAYSRLKLNAHSIKQVVAGYALGFFCETIILFFV